MVTWGIFRDNIRSSLVKDVSASQKWTDNELALFCGWAMDEFCLHTAKTMTSVFDSSRLKPDGITYYDLLVDKIYHLESPPFDEFAYTSTIFAVTGDKTSVLPSLIYPHPTLYGYHMVNNSVRINPAPSCDSLHIQYYSYWEHPVLATDILDLPQWAEPIVAYRVALHCYTYQAGRNSMVRQWDEKGNREQNPVREHQLWLEEAYQAMLARYPQQVRRVANAASG